MLVDAVQGHGDPGKEPEDHLHIPSAVVIWDPHGNAKKIAPAVTGAAPPASSIKSMKTSQAEDIQSVPEIRPDSSCSLPSWTDRGSLSFESHQRALSELARRQMGMWLGSLRPWTHWITLTFGRPEELSTLEAERRARANIRTRGTGRTVMHEQAIRNFIECLKIATFEECEQVEPERITRKKSKKGHTLFRGSRVRSWDRSDRPRWAIAVEENPGRMGTHIHALVDFTTSSTPPRLALLREVLSRQGIDQTRRIASETEATDPSPLPGYTNWNLMSYAQKRAAYMVKYCLKSGSSELALDDLLRSEGQTHTQGTLTAAC